MLASVAVGPSQPDATASAGLLSAIDDPFVDIDINLGGL
jgi:hypothetical protein